MSAAFSQAWLRADTYVAGVNAAQRRAIRVLCEKFYEAGRKAEREKQHDKQTSPPAFPSNS